MSDSWWQLFQGAYAPIPYQPLLPPTLPNVDGLPPSVALNSVNFGPFFAAFLAANPGITTPPPTPAAPGVVPAGALVLGGIGLALNGAYVVLPGA